MTEVKLGEELWLTAFAVRYKDSRRKMSLDVVQEINMKVTETIEMNMEGLHAATWKFPALGGGGVGWTHVQPIIESFLIGDWWDEHDVLYYIVGSCKQYNARQVGDILIDLGFEIIAFGQMKLAIPAKGGGDSGA